MSNVKHPNRLRELREQRHLYQEDVARVLGLSPSAVARHEQGNRSLDAWAIHRYAQFYQVSPYELFIAPTEEDPAYVGLRPQTV